MKFKFLPKLRYVLFGLLLYVLFLVTTFPASVAYGYWKQYLGKRQDITLSALSGSIWSGKAGTSRIAGQQLESLQWQFQPWSLLTGRAELKWAVRVPEGYAKGYAGVNVLGNVNLHDVEGLSPVELVARIAKMGPLKPEGSLAINLDSVQLTGKVPTRINGSVTWHNAEITLFKPLSLGGLTAKFSSTADTIKGVLSDDGGPLQLQGLVTLTPAGDYDLNLALSARDPKQTDLANALRGLGRPDNRGQYHLKRKGKLANLRL